MKALQSALFIALGTGFAALVHPSAEAGTLELSICREAPVGSAPKCSAPVRRGACRMGFFFDGQYQLFTMAIDSGPHAGTYQGVIGNLDWGPEGTRPVKISGGLDGRVGELQFDSHYRVIAAGYADLNIGREQYYRYRCRQAAASRDTSRPQGSSPSEGQPRSVVR